MQASAKNSHTPTRHEYRSVGRSSQEARNGSSNGSHSAVGGIASAVRMLICSLLSVAAGAAPAAAAAASLVEPHRHALAARRCQRALLLRRRRPRREVAAADRRQPTSATDGFRSDLWLNHRLPAVDSSTSQKQPHFPAQAAPARPPARPPPPTPLPPGPTACLTR